jgi:hypothetical protein
MDIILGDFALSLSSYLLLLAQLKPAKGCEARE